MNSFCFDVYKTNLAICEELLDMRCTLFMYLKVLSDACAIQLYYHRMGTDQSEEILCVELPENREWQL